MAEKFIKIKATDALGNEVITKAPASGNGEVLANTDATGSVKSSRQLYSPDRSEDTLVVNNTDYTTSTGLRTSGGDADLSDGIAYIKQITAPAGGTTLTSIVTTGFNAFNYKTSSANVISGNVYHVSGSFSVLAYNGTITITLSNINGVDNCFRAIMTGTVVVVGGDATTCIALLWSGYRANDFEEYWLETKAINYNLLANSTLTLKDLATNTYLLTVGGSTSEVVLDLQYKVSDFGTEQFNFTNEPTIVVSYMQNLRDKLRRLPDEGTINDEFLKKDDAEQLYADKDEVAKKADIDGTYVGLTAGSAINIKSKDSPVDTSGYSFDTSGGSADITTGEATLVSIIGNMVTTGEYTPDYVSITSWNTSLSLDNIDNDTLLQAYKSNNAILNLFYNGSTWSTLAGGVSVNLADLGISVSGVANSGDSIIMSYSNRVYQQASSVNPRKFISTGINAFNGTYAKVLGGHRYNVTGTFTSLSYSTSVGGTLVSLTLDEGFVTERGGVAAHSFVLGSAGEVYYVYVNGSSTDTMIALLWSGPFVTATAIDTGVEGYSGAYWTSEILLPTVDINNNQLDYVTYGLCSIGSVADELNLTLKKYIKRVGKLQLSDENLALTKEKERVVTSSVIYYVLDSAEEFTLPDSAQNIFNVDDMGTCELRDGNNNLCEIKAFVSCVFGDNLVDKLTRMPDPTDLTGLLENLAIKELTNMFTVRSLSTSFPNAATKNTKWILTQTDPDAELSDFIQWIDFSITASSSSSGTFFYVNEVSIDAENSRWALIAEHDISKTGFIFKPDTPFVLSNEHSILLYTDYDLKYGTDNTTPVKNMTMRVANGSSSGTYSGAKFNKQFVGDYTVYYIPDFHGISVSTDKSLTKANIAADSAVVGEIITNINRDIYNIQNKVIEQEPTTYPGTGSAKSAPTTYLWGVTLTNNDGKDYYIKSITPSFHLDSLSGAQTFNVYKVSGGNITLIGTGSSCNIDGNGTGSTVEINTVIRYGDLIAVQSPQGAAIKYGGSPGLFQLGYTTSVSSSTVLRYNGQGAITLVYTFAEVDEIAYKSYVDSKLDGNTETVSYRDTPCILALGSSLTEDSYKGPSDGYLKKYNDMTDLLICNDGQSGFHTVGNINWLLSNHALRFNDGQTPRGLRPSYVWFKNCANGSATTLALDGVDKYMEETASMLGAKVLLGNEEPYNGWNLTYAKEFSDLNKQFAAAHNWKFSPMCELMVHCYKDNPAGRPYYRGDVQGGNHTGWRLNCAFMPEVDMLNTLPIEKGIKLYRPRAALASGSPTITDLVYDTVRQRNQKFVALSAGGLSGWGPGPMDNGDNHVYDTTGTAPYTYTSYTTDEVSRYLHGDTLAFNKWALIECILPVSNCTKFTFKAKLSVTPTAIYLAKNKITSIPTPNVQSLDVPLPNTVFEVVSSDNYSVEFGELTLNYELESNEQSFQREDKIRILIEYSSTFNLGAPEVSNYNGVPKTMDKPEWHYRLEGTELRSATSMSNVTIPSGSTAAIESLPDNYTATVVADGVTPDLSNNEISRGTACWVGSSTGAVIRDVTYNAITVSLKPQFGTSTSVNKMRLTDAKKINPSATVDSTVTFGDVSFTVVADNADPLIYIYNGQNPITAAYNLFKNNADFTGGVIVPGVRFYTDYTNVEEHLKLPYQQYVTLPAITVPKDVTKVAIRLVGQLFTKYSSTRWNGTKYENSDFMSNSYTHIPYNYENGTVKLTITVPNELGTSRVFYRYLDVYSGWSESYLELVIPKGQNDSRTMTIRIDNDSFVNSSYDNTAKPILIHAMSVQSVE